MATKTNKKANMEDDSNWKGHSMMHSHSKWVGLIYIIIGAYLLWSAYLYDAPLILPLLAFGVSVGLLVMGLSRLGFSCMGMCGGCGCDCDCDMEQKK